MFFFFAPKFMADTIARHSFVRTIAIVKNAYPGRDASLWTFSCCLSEDI